jgi:hypothetical protein
MKTAVQCEASDLVRALQDMADRTKPFTVSKAADCVGMSIVTLQNWIACGKVQTLPPLHGRCYGKRVPRTELAKIRARKQDE